MSTQMRKLSLALALLLAASLSALRADDKASSSAAQRRLSPVFPYSPPGLVYAEGEDAVSTNMATEPTLNYGCSGSRALQLSRKGQLPGGSPFYAEYCVYVEEAGSYELWYCGSPPGSKDEFAISFASPVSVSIDGAAPRELFREDVNVVERIAPAYYWVRTSAVQLAAGPHVLRFEVSAKRRLDDRFFFYLDAFFLATPQALAAASQERSGYPDRFPTNPSERSIDNPFRGFEDYLAQIAAKPSELAPYVELADEYSLAGDYLSALKTLSKASVVAPRDPAVRLLFAKNRIWRGDVKEGIEAYGVYLSLRPDDISAYEEAGKVAAWSGRYSDAEYFYRSGLAAFPGDLSLTVNLGLCLLWSGRVNDAERSFELAQKAALAGASTAARLAEVYRDNGLPDRAIAAYDAAIGAYPDRLGLYLDEESVLAARGQEAAARGVEERIASTFEPSPQLDAALATAKARRELKSNRIAELESRIAASPGDLGLRDELTRVYAWNGRRAEAARELESILAARFAKSLSDSDAQAASIYAAQFSAAALQGDADARLGSAAALAAKAQSAQAAANKVLAELAGREKAAQSAAAAGKAAVPTDSAREAAAAALGAFAGSLSALEAEDARLGLLVERASLLKADFEALSASEDKDQKAFKAIASGLGWSFDPAFAAAELAQSAGRGEQIAALGRARVLLPGDPKAALASLSSLSAESLLPARRLAELMLAGRRDYRALFKAAQEAQTSEVRPPRSDLGGLTSEAIADTALAAAAAELAAVAAAPTPEPGQDREPPAADADAAALEAYAAALRSAQAAAQAADAELRAKTQAAKAELALVFRSASTFEDQRLERAWYSFESGALDLRSELGAYYDGLGQAEAATKQYRRVLALDAANLRAMQSLALAEDASGDWAAAASLFKAVYAADPYYGNAASLYNGIAQRHAPSYDASTAMVADSNLFDYRSDASALFPLSSTISLKPFASVRTERDRSQGYPAYLAASLGLEAPVNLGPSLGLDSGSSLGLRPKLSLAGTSADFPASGAATVSPAQFAGALSLYSAASLGLDWSTGAWYGSADYSYGPLPNSLDPSSSPLFAHRLELSAAAYYPLGGAFRYLAPRIYASGGYVPEDSGNLYGSALLELVPAFRLSDSPWSSLGLPLDLLYEDSRIARSTPYYAASEALTAKGGLRWQSDFGQKDGSTLSVLVQALGGAYFAKAFSASPAAYPYLGAFARLDWIRKLVTYSLSLEASATDPFASAPKYWSFSLVGGVSAKSPELIAP